MEGWLRKRRLELAGKCEEKENESDRQFMATMTNKMAMSQYMGAACYPPVSYLHRMDHSLLYLHHMDRSLLCLHHTDRIPSWMHRFYIVLFKINEFLCSNWNYTSAAAIVCADEPSFFNEILYSVFCSGSAIWRDPHLPYESVRICTEDLGSTALAFADARYRESRNSADLRKLSVLRTICLHHMDNSSSIPSRSMIPWYSQRLDVCSSPRPIVVAVYLERLH